MSAIAVLRAASAFRTAFETRDFAPALEVLAEDVSFASPVVVRPWRGREVLAQLGTAMVDVFDEIAFDDELAGGRTRVLLFHGRLAELDAGGTLILRTGEDGLVEELTMMVRPLTALNAVAAAMVHRLDPELLAAH